MESGEVAIDHAVHVRDVALLARVEPQPVEAARLHSRLHLEHVVVVLGGDEPPVVLVPVGVELARERSRLTTRCRPFEYPRVLDRGVGIETVRPYTEEDRAARIDGPDEVREP